jgi:hypothetical protein
MEHHLRRILTLLVGLAPLLAGADLCTLGAIAGRPDMACSMEAASRPVAPAGVKHCPYCGTKDAPRESPRSQAPTCCDLRPQASGVAIAPLPGAPASHAHPAVAVAVAAPAAPVVSGFRPAPDVGRAPPGEPPAPLSPRAPPLG